MIPECDRHGLWHTLCQQYPDTRGAEGGKLGLGVCGLCQRSVLSMRRWWRGLRRLQEGLEGYKQADKI